MMKLVPAHPAHFDLLDLREQEHESFALDPQSGVNIESLINISISSTMMYNGVVLAILGFYQLFPGVLNVWILPSTHIHDNTFRYLRSVRKYVESLKRDIPCHRIQSLAISDEMHDRWMSFLGFEKEGVLKKYSADKVDYTYWAIINDG